MGPHELELLAKSIQALTHALLNRTISPDQWHNLINAIKTLPQKPQDTWDRMIDYFIRIAPAASAIWICLSYQNHADNNKKSREFEVEQECDKQYDQIIAEFDGQYAALMTADQKKQDDLKKYRRFYLLLISS